MRAALLRDGKRRQLGAGGQERSIRPSERPAIALNTVRR